MFSLERRMALNRAHYLFKEKPAPKASVAAFTASDTQACNTSEAVFEGLRLALYQADLKLPVWSFVLCSTCICAAALLGCAQVVSAYFLPIVAVSAFFLPYFWLESRIRKRALEFASDYPTVLMAAASSVKAGMTPYAAFQRSTQLLPNDSLVRAEVQRLLSNLEKGTAREIAIRQFGASIRQPDLDLFRSAFLLILENGGRFAPTLERLASVSKDRSILIRSAEVTTANMRMTANFILAVTPLIMAVVSLRSSDFWDILLNHPVANAIASAGILMIGLGYASLRRMASFRP